jgi:hypothetical protein
MFSSPLYFSIISLTNSIFLLSKAFCKISSDIFISSSIICSSLAQVEGLSEITEQYSGILHAKL